MARERGQATVELVAAIPLLLIAGLVALQLLLAGYALTLADGAAEAGALALAAGRPAKSAAAGPCPAGRTTRSRSRCAGERSPCGCGPPSPLTAVADRLAVTSAAFARPAGR